ncbi:MAG TPA: helix-turn-helix transcriptional regulator [Bacteroidia bacterium]|jgi:transcriptional regulator with XRE-family HTH domain|nr:helix-turn-helix transcriptional regulator [Bacteroidia bacterium]
MKSEDLLKRIGENIVKFRKIKGLTSQDLGYLCDIDKSQLGKIEKGKINVTVKTLIKIANELGISLKELI